MAFPVPGRIAELLRRSVVQIRGGSRRFQGTGSGIVLNGGRIVTNAHVLTSGDTVAEAWDGQTERLKLIKQDSRRDLALLSIENLSAPAATFAGGSPRAGAPVIAVGNPLGFVGAVSTGTIQRVGSVRGLGERRWIQSDLRLAPGNSGGPLADIHGQIIGVNTMIAGPLALAIPVDAVQAFLSGAATPSLGVTVKPVLVRRAGTRLRFGLVLLELAAGGAADRASLLPGDVLVSAAGKALFSPEDLYDAIASHELLTLGFMRGGSAQERKVTVQLEASRAVHAA